MLNEENELTVYGDGRYYRQRDQLDQSYGGHKRVHVGELQVCSSYPGSVAESGQEGC